MTLYEISEADDPNRHFVKVADTPVGKGVFAGQPYPATAIIGRIAGSLKEFENHTSAYCFEFDDTHVLEPCAPFRYLNHSCDPNCEFLMLETPREDGLSVQDDLYLVALRDLEPGEEFTIAYNWPADSAIECQCNSPDCVGWVVCPTELDIIHTVSEFTQQQETKSEKTLDTFCIEGC